MKNSKALMERAGVLPRLRLGVKLEKGGVQATGAHTVRILSDIIQKGKHKQTGELIDIVRYTIEENGQPKWYDVPVKDEAGDLHYLVQRLSEVPEGEEVVIEMKKRGARNYIDVRTTDGKPIGDKFKEEEPEEEEGVADTSDLEEIG